MVTALVGLSVMLVLFVFCLFGALVLMRKPAKAVTHHVPSVASFAPAPLQAQVSIREQMVDEKLMAIMSAYRDAEQAKFTKSAVEEAVQLLAPKPGVAVV